MIYNKNGIVIRESVEQDVDALSGRLRDADFKEIIAAGHKDQDEALRQSFALSKLRYSVELDDVVVAMFGVVSEGAILAPVGRVWFLGSDELGRIRKSFVRLSRQMLAEFLKSYPVLYNAVDCRYLSAIAWLRSCGAVFNDATILLNGVDFRLFSINHSYDESRKKNIRKKLLSNKHDSGESTAAEIPFETQKTDQICREDLSRAEQRSASGYQSAVVC